MDHSLVSSHDEQTLITRAVMDRSAFAALYDLYFPRVYNYARYRVHDAMLADDITSQAFERVLSALSHYDVAIAPFGAWLFTIVRNTVRDHQRQAQRQRWLSLDALTGRSSGAARQPEEVAARSEWRRQVLDAVRRLNEREREIIALKYGANLSNQELALLLGLTPNHVNVLVSRSYDRLRKMLQPVEDNTEGVS
jgi:RNA polymerase sigma-70 factor, ECF subfamily